MAFIYLLTLTSGPEHAFSLQSMHMRSEAEENIYGCDGSAFY